MKTDNSRNFEERYNSGYTERCNELTHANLIVIETELYQITDYQLNYFNNLYTSAKYDKNLQSIALDWIKNNGVLLNTITHTYNY
jgi:hypothetical protein